MNTAAPDRSSASNRRRGLLGPGAFSTYLVAIAAVVAYVVWAVTVVAAGDPVRLANVGQRFLDQGRGASPAIDRLKATSDEGYDGQFALYLALDPQQAADYMDWPRYRYGRIVYPVLARAFSLGEPTALGWALLALNIAAVGVLTLALALWLRRNGASAWYAAIAGFAPGLAVGVLRDLTEPLAYAFVAIGMVFVTGSLRNRDLAFATAAFAIAGLTRETTLLFPIAVALSLLLWTRDVSGRRASRPRAAAILLAGSCVPVMLWRTALPHIVGGPPPDTAFSFVPFSGLSGLSPSNDDGALQLATVALPAFFALFLVALFGTRLTASAIALALNFVVLVVLLDDPGWEEFLGSGRISYGVVLAFVLCLPAIQPSGRRLLVALLPASAWAFGWVELLPLMRGA